MKIFKQIVSTIAVLILLGMSSVGIFSLSSASIENQKAKVAIVNEDNGLVANSKEIRFGSDFVKLFTQNTDGHYEVTTRTAAQEGLNEGKYDLLIIVPKNFTQKALTYNSSEPETAFLEYTKSQKLSQSEAFKADSVTKVLKETANKTLIQTFTLEVLKTMQAMQGKSLKIIENEVKYQKSFKDNVEKPMADAMSNFNSSLGALISQQGLLGHFDSSVKSFESSVKGQAEAEQKHMQDFEEQRKRYDETNKLFSGWTTSYNETLKNMKDNNTIGNLVEAQKLRKTSAEELIQNLKMNAVQLEFQIKKMSDYKIELEEISKAYEGVVNTGIIPADTTDKKLKAINDQVNGLLGSENNQGQPDGKITKATQTIVEETKTNIETKQFTNICSNISGNLKSLPVGYEKQIADAREYCSKGSLKMKNEKVANTTVLYKQMLIMKLPADSKSIDVSKYGKGLTAEYKYSTEPETAWQELKSGVTTVFDSTKNEEIDVKVTFSHTESIADGSEIVPYVPAKDEKFTYTLTKKNLKVGPAETLLPNIINGEIQGTQRPMQKETLDAIMQLDTLSNLYYGKSVSDLMKEYNAKPTQEDGVKKYRVHAKTDGSLISQLDRILDKKQIRIELNKAFAEELKKNVDEVHEKMRQYIEELQKLTNGALDETKLDDNGIYKDSTKTEMKDPSADYYKTSVSDESKIAGSLNATIDLAIKQHTETSTLLTDLTAFDSKFQNWLKQYDTISGKVGEITKLHEDEGKISVQLEESQKELLTGVASLQKSITGQLEATQHIMSDADKLKNDAEGSKKKIEEDTKKLNVTKKKFDETVKDNSNFVNDFIRKYISAQSGGADNQLFYTNYANPVGVKEKNSSHSNNLISFFMILMAALFAFMIARFFSERRRNRIELSEHGADGIFAGLTLQMLLIIISAIVASGIVAYIGVTAISDTSSMNVPLMAGIIGATVVTLSFIFYLFMFQLKKLGTQIVAGLIGLYFITNGALGLTLVKNDSFTWLRLINPLVYLEQALQNVILNQNIALQSLTIVLFLITMISIVIIYLLQPLAYRRKQNEKIS